MPIEAVIHLKRYDLKTSLNNNTSICNSKLKLLLKSETATRIHSDTLVNCSDALHLCSANFSHRSA